MGWIDEHAVMAHELGAARFLLEHYFAGTADAHVRRETRAWLDRARGSELANTDPSDKSGPTGAQDKVRRPDRPVRPGGSPFDWMGE